MSYERDLLLSELGYSSYENYRSSALWKRIRSRVLDRDDHTCLRCFGQAEVVHHRTYSRAVLVGDDDEALVSLCDGCHHVVEFDDSGVRREHEDREIVLAMPSMQIDYPPVRVDLRLRNVNHPLEWDRMNWWQRTGWSHAYEHQRITRKWPDLPFLPMYAAIVDAITHRTHATTWRDVLALRKQAPNPD